MKILNLTKTKRKDFLPPPSKPRKRKAPENCNLSFIDQGTDEDYSGAKLVRNEPKTTKDIYFKSRPRKARPTEMRSCRRHYSHRSAGLFRTKKDGPTKANLEYLLCSFLEIDGSTDNTIKTKEDVQALIEKNSLPEPYYGLQTSEFSFF